MTERFSRNVCKQIPIYAASQTTEYPIFNATEAWKFLIIYYFEIRAQPDFIPGSRSALGYGK